jgi:hypothetical protein
MASGGNKAGVRPPVFPQMARDAVEMPAKGGGRVGGSGSRFRRFAGLLASRDFCNAFRSAAACVGGSSFGRAPVSTGRKGSRD